MATRPHVFGEVQIYKCVASHAISPVLPVSAEEAGVKAVAITRFPPEIVIALLPTAPPEVTVIGPVNEGLFIGA